MLTTVCILIELCINNVADVLFQLHYNSGTIFVKTGLHGLHHIYCVLDKERGFAIKGCVTMQNCAWSTFMLSKY